MSKSWPRGLVRIAVLLALIVPFLGTNLIVTLRHSTTTDEQRHDADTPTFSGGGALQTTINTFPQWGHKGISLQPFLDFVSGIQNRTASTVANPKTRGRFPETLYVVDINGLWVSHDIRQRTLPGMLKARVLPTELMFHAAWNKLLSAKPNSHERWPRIYHALQSDGFPFLVWYGDYKSCNEKNWNGAFSIPLFTVCARVGCNHTIPMPNYSTIKSARNSPKEWDSVFYNYSVEYPVESKIQRIVWRGSLSAPNDNLTSVRWRATELTKNYEIFDVGLTAIPSRHDHLKLNLSKVGGLKQPILPMQEFQRYAGILDVDGNAWSSRWAEMLCYNSVALKVEPEYVDYFHFRDLKPWQHYVPVKADLSDIFDAAQYVVDPSNRHAVAKIIASANQWCRYKLLKASLQEDMIDIWEAYLVLLERADPNWQAIWSEAKSRIFRPAFDMRPLPL